MYAHEYICFFTKYEYFMYFSQSVFYPVFCWFRFGSRSGSHVGLHWFDDLSGSDNINWVYLVEELSIMVLCPHILLGPLTFNRGRVLFFEVTSPKIDFKTLEE